jgi:hypothetical protein
MKQYFEINKTNLIDIIDTINTELKTLSTKIGIDLTIEKQHILYDPATNSFTARIDGVLAGDQANVFDKKVTKFNPKYVGKYHAKVMIQNKIYTIVGVNQQARKYYLILNDSQGKTYSVDGNNPIPFI